MCSPGHDFVATRVILALTLLAIVGCQRSAPTGPAAETASTAAAKAPDARVVDAASVTLSAEDIEKLGVQTRVPKPATWVPETAGYALVMSHDVIAQAVADLSSAQAAVRQSRAALARFEQLAGGIGALPPEAYEAAERQAGIDAAALTLAERRLSMVVGEHPVWSGGDSAAALAALASGHRRLLRVTFPLGSALPAQPTTLRFRRIGAQAGEGGWSTHALWPAPADASMPGRSLFALLDGSEASEGEHLEAWAPIGAAQQGLMIPASSIVQAADQYWCYVQTGAGAFTRTPIETLQPIVGGYFVNEGFDPEQPIVTAAAGLLLARELNPSPEAE